MMQKPSGDVYAKITAPEYQSFLSGSESGSIEVLVERGSRRLAFELDAVSTMWKEKSSSPTRPLTFLYTYKRLFVRERQGMDLLQ